MKSQERSAREKRAGGAIQNSKFKIQNSKLILNSPHHTPHPTPHTLSSP
ncbi:hypothetical protein [Chroococcidiopsis thermalis]|nr:hypothetical protein [Chroococcidiopsis thermalis]